MKKWKLASLLVAAISGSAIANDNEYHYVKIFYSDASKTHAVGTETLYCDLQSEQSGMITEYYKYHNGFCP